MCKRPSSTSGSGRLRGAGLPGGRKSRPDRCSAGRSGRIHWRPFQVRLRLPTWPFLGAPLPAWGAGQSVPTDLATENSEGHPAPPKSQARAHPSRRGLGLYLVGRVSSQSWAQRPRRAVPPPPGRWRLAGICGPAF